MRFRIRSFNYYFRHQCLAFQFLTIIPVSIDVRPDEINRSVSYFVVVGLFQGLLLLTVLNLSERLFHADLAIFIVLLSYILLNGALHLDGLSDTFDAIAVRSATVTFATNGDRQAQVEKRLSVMKDSYTGPIGVTSVVSVIFLKYLSLKNISHLIPYVYYSSVFLMPVVSKLAMVTAMFHGRPARADGLGQLFIGRVKRKEVFINLFTLFLIYILLYALFLRYMPERYWIFYLLSTGILYLFSLFWTYFCNKRFNGLTGDTLGALSELSEVIFLLSVIVWSRLSI